MSQEIKDTINYNSTYISLNLLDELDFYLGGYGKPNVEFIFSLNTFVESFIACSEFYTSLDELNHLNLTAPALFPSGRPILNLVVRETGLKFVSGVIKNPGKVIYKGDGSGMSKKEAEQAFIGNYGKIIQDKYLIRSNINPTIEKIPLITSEFYGTDFIVSEVLSTSRELVSNLIDVSRTSSIQTTLPIYLFDHHINTLTKTPFSIESLNQVAKIYEANLEDLKQSLGITYMPIPPFTNILLSQLNSISEIPAKLSQLREDFQELRIKFIELEQQIHQADTMKQQLEAHKSFKEFWNAFNRKYVDKTNRIFYGHLDMAQGANIDKSVDSLLDGADLGKSLKDMNLGKLAGNIISKVYTWNEDRRVINRFKGLTNIWELFENSKSISQQFKHFERIFGVKYSSEDLNLVHKYVQKNITDITTIIKN